MSERTPLEWQHLTAMQAAMEERANTIVRGVLQQPDYPPLPACPTCDRAPERITSTVEPPRFGVDEDAVLTDFNPCGHRFRTVVPLEVS